MHTADTTENGAKLIDWTAWTGPKQFTHTFQNPGSFNCTAIIKNNFNYSEFWTTVDVYNKVENLTLNSNTPVPYLVDKAIAYFWYTSPTPPPTKAKIHWQYGNGDPDLKDDTFLVSTSSSFL